MIADSKHLANLTLPRCIVPPVKEIETVQLHLSTDISEMAYAAVIYIPISDISGKDFTNLVAAKTRVAPIKTVSLPGLELCGAHLGIKLRNKNQEILDLTPFGHHPIRVHGFLCQGISTTAYVTLDPSCLSEQKLR